MPYRSLSPKGFVTANRFFPFVDAVFEVHSFKNQKNAGHFRSGVEPQFLDLPPPNFDKAVVFYHSQSFS